MNNKHLLYVFLILVFLLGLFFYSNQASAVSDSLTATVRIRVCGNGIIETGEQCEGNDFNGATCISLGYVSGTLSCNSDCTFNVSQCISSSGGGGGGSVSTQTATRVVLKGKAYPGSLVRALVDGKISETDEADSDANFRISITDIDEGVYTFSIWSEDSYGIRSITYSFTFNVIEGVVNTVSGIFLPPTIKLNKEVLERGEILDVFGQTVPETKVNIHIFSNEKIESVESDELGAWLLSFDTSHLEEGEHKSKAFFEITEEEKSGFSRILSFIIGKGSVDYYNIADLNKDSRVNLVDFSILLFWWGKDIELADINKNGQVDLPDFSIMLYFWTG